MLASDGANASITCAQQRSYQRKGRALRPSSDNSVAKRHTLYYDAGMKYFSWNTEKNALLKQERGVTLEEVVFHIMNGQLLATLEHPNQAKYPGQRLFVVNIEDYAHLIPFVESDREIFLKTIIPSRKATRQYLRDLGMTELDKEERDMLESFERDEWVPVADRQGENERFRGYAEATFKKDRRINIRISQKDLDAIQMRALEEGIPYQTLIASVLHKYLSGRLIERPN